MEESKEYEIKKDKLEQQLTKAYQINDVKKIVVIKDKLIKLCSSYAATKYKKFSINYQFKEINGVMRLKADVQETVSPKLTGAQVLEIMSHTKKEVTYNDDYLYEYKTKDDESNNESGNGVDYCTY